MHKQEAAGSNIRTILALCLVLLPAILFYAILIKTSFNLPLLDDYHALLQPANHLRTMSGLRRDLSYYLAMQHNEYKLWLDTGAAWLQESVLGHLNFRVLSLAGDSFVLGLGMLLWRLFSARDMKFTERLLWFAPASWLVFQLSYAETLNWPMAGLQNIPVVVFSLIGLMLLMRTGWGPFTLAVFCLVGAVAASGNGLLVIPVGLLALALQRRYAQLACWLVAAAVLVSGYAYHFNVLSSQTAERRSILVTLRHFSPMYTLAMMGSEGTRHGAVILGLLLFALNIYLLWTGYFRTHPAIGYCTLFLLLTAVGVGGIRSEFGIAQAVSSRYHMYCMLLLVFAWFAWVDRMLTYGREEQSRRVLIGALIVTIMFALSRDWWGYRMLKARESYTKSGMEAYQKSLSAGGILGPVFWIPDVNPAYGMLNPSARTTLTESIALGTYTPPK